MPPAFGRLHPVRLRVSACHNVECCRFLIVNKHVSWTCWQTMQQQSSEWILFPAWHCHCITPITKAAHPSWASDYRPMDLSRQYCRACWKDVSSELHISRTAAATTGIVFLQTNSRLDPLAQRMPFWSHCFTPSPPRSHSSVFANRL